MGNYIININATALNSPKIIKYCSKCNKKTRFINSNMFRMNANGSTQDVWLIYHCEVCNTTYNLTVLERVPTKKIPIDEFKKFENNDFSLARDVSLDQSIVKKNNVILDWNSLDVSYETSILYEHTLKKNIIKINNIDKIKIRIEKVLSIVFGLSRSRVMELIINGEIYSEDINLKKITTKSNITIYCINEELINYLISK